jgi:hypothetical protein
MQLAGTLIKHLYAFYTYMRDLSRVHLLWFLSGANSRGLHLVLFGSQGVRWISCGENRLRYSPFSSVLGGWPV